MSDSRSYLNSHGIEISNILPGDKYSYVSGESGEVNSIDWNHKRVWGLWREEGRDLILYLDFEDIRHHEPQFKPYDPTQVGDREDDI